MKFPNLIIFIWFMAYFKKVEGVCEISTGESAAIVEIQESRDDQISQKTVPEELPIIGEESELQLRIESGSQDFFTIQGKKLKLTKPLDRDETGLSSIRLIVSCTSKSTTKQFPVVVLVRDINDNPPTFSSTNYEINVPELTPVETTIFRGLTASDKDTGQNSLVEFSTIPGDGGTNDGYGIFSIILPHQGLVTLNKPLNFEKAKLYYLTIVVTDKASDEKAKLSATSTLTIHVKDDDDLDPTFVYKGCTSVNNGCVNAEYSATVTSGTSSEVLTLSPENIRAIDGDSLNSPIRYNFVKGSPSNYNEIFGIDSLTGTITQKQVIDRIASRRFDIIVKAEEQTEAKRFTTAKLSIDVLAVDRNPPVLTATAYEGYVDENANVGTTVVTARGGQSQLRFKVTDADIAPGDSPPRYQFELTTNAFKVDADGFLVVNTPNLDRDQPNLAVLRFQVSARETNSGDGKGTSAPVTIVVTLNDINDNAPQLPSLSAITVQAGSTIRNLQRVEAKDNDDGEYAKIKYSLHHVSNNGLDKFQINPDTGELQAIGNLAAGKQYSLLIQATDIGGKYSQSILDVLVSPGPNTGGPVFTQNVYNVQISEGASVKSSVLTVVARDPENDAVSYSIVDGNMKKHFKIDSKTGVIKVGKKLDRETVDSYTLIIQASDESNLYSTVRVNIELTDINDRNPEFLQPFYVFSIEEGLADTVIGSVQARDDDSSINSEITYFVPKESGLVINELSGVLRTKQALDYEKQKIHSVVVTAKDGAENPRIATATVTLSVLDIQDERPVFERRVYESSVPENERNFKILQVKAKDPDSISSITYTIKMGPQNVFRIDPITGFIYTVIPIDYEIQNRFELVIGTIENEAIHDPMSTCTVFINVIDRNDLPPVFTGILQPITILSDALPGSTVTTVIATDGDSTAPGNQVKYSITGRGKASSYFKIDDDTGVITTKEYLRNDPQDEYEIEVKAFDSGSPPLMSTTTVTVYVERVSAQLLPQINLGLSDSRYTVEIEENSPVDTVVKVLKVINKPPGNSPVGCKIDDGNEDEVFYVVTNREKDCVLRTKKDTIDFETKSKYLLRVVISSPGIYSHSPKLTAMVAVSVIDLNDNPPYFVVPPTYSKATNSRYLAVASKDTPAFTPIVRIKAEDRDMGLNRQIKYSIMKDTDPDNFFMIDEDTGFVSNKRTFEIISEQHLPFKISVLSRDTPTIAGKSLSAETELIVNLVEDENRMVLVVHGTSPDKFNNQHDKLMTVLQDHTGMIIGIEKVETMKKFLNNTIQTQPMSTDIWIYAIDPVTLNIVSRSNINLRSSLQAKDSKGILLSKISTSLGVQAEDIRIPFVKPVVGAIGVKPYKLKDDLDGFQAALIALAGIIIVLGIIAVIYLCFLWSRFTKHKDRMKRMYIVPKYEPVLVEPSMKEYETQVLQMSIPLDDDGSISDLNLTQISNSKSIEHVSYITKNQANSIVSSSFGADAASAYSQPQFSEADAESSPKDMPNPSIGVRASSTATTARASSLDSGPSSNASNLLGYDPEFGIKSTQNPLFEDKYSSDEEESYASVNRKKHASQGSFKYKKSVAESTTEL